MKWLVAIGAGLGITAVVSTALLLAHVTTGNPSSTDAESANGYDGVTTRKVLPGSQLQASERVLDPATGVTMPVPSGYYVTRENLYYNRSVLRRTADASYLLVRKDNGPADAGPPPPGIAINIIDEASDAWWADDLDEPLCGGSLEPDAPAFPNDQRLLWHCPENASLFVYPTVSVVWAENGHLIEVLNSPEVPCPFDDQCTAFLSIVEAMKPEAEI
jgi:hypothetical protein